MAPCSVANRFCYSAAKAQANTAQTQIYQPLSTADAYKTHRVSLKAMHSRNDRRPASQHAGPDARQKIKFLFSRQLRPILQNRCG